MFLAKSEDKENEQIKICFIGEQNVGKTNIINRAKGEKFNENYNPSFGYEFSEKKILLNNREYKLQLLDTFIKRRFFLDIPNFFIEII